MFLLSVKVTKRGVIASVCVVLVFAAAMFGLTALAKSSDERASAEKNGNSLEAATNEERVRYLTAFGWELAEDPYEVAEVIIPEKFGEVYEQYNSIQKAQGFDLEKYKGKRVKRWTYQVTNYPDNPDVVANLLIYNDEVIGGDVCSVALDGFMHGFAIKSQLSAADLTS